MIKFQLAQEEELKYKEWAQTHECRIRKNGVNGVHKFSFVPTVYGIITTVECQCGAFINLTNYDKWKDN